MILPLLSATIPQSAVSLFSLLEQFEFFSGLKINKSKTEGLWLESWKITVGRDKPFGISWPKHYVSSLGVIFAYERRFGDKSVLTKSLLK